MLDASTRACDFPSLAGMIYLNSAAEGIPPLCVRDALLQYYQDKQLGMDGRLLHEAQWKAARGLTASFYGLTSEEVAICSCSSEAYNLAAMALQLRPGDEIIINDLEFPAGATPWLQQSSPATVKVWRHRDGFLHLEDLVSLLHSKTRFINVSQVSFLNGFRIHTPSLVEVVRKHSNALIGLDVTQALGRIPLDLHGVDLIVSSTHKWILASHGGGLVGVPASKNTSLTVPAGGWFNLQDPFGLTGSPRPEASRGRTALQWECQTTPQFMPSAQAWNTSKRSVWRRLIRQPDHWFYTVWRNWPNCRLNSSHPKSPTMWQASWRFAMPRPISCTNICVPKISMSWAMPDGCVLPSMATTRMKMWKP